MGICTHLNLYFLKFYFTSEFKIMIFHHVNAGTFIISKHVPGEKGVILIMLVTTFFFYSLQDRDRGNSRFDRMERPLDSMQN